MSSLTFKDILVFSTGSDAVPAVGFQPQPSVSFAADDSKYPRGKTCGNELELPVINKTYSDFKENMEFGILNSSGFGMA